MTGASQGVGPELPLVLVADNDAGVNDLLREVLARNGLRTEAVFDGAEALRRTTAGGVALLVCDLDMPTMDGQELLRRLCEAPSAPPAIVVSGYLDADIEAELAGMTIVRAVFRKPFEVFAFAERARSVVEERRAGVPRPEGTAGGETEQA